VDEAVKILGRDSEIVSCVYMRAVGDVDADVFVTLPKRHLEVLKALARSAHPQGSRMPSDMASSVLMETANILTGAYFAAIADFCGLRVFHSVPALATDRLNVLLDESIASLSYKNQECLVIENELAAGGGATTVLTVLLIIEGASFARLVSSAREARERMTK
jgi:chemotaxis protein CheY-P-specific phosphatase CheC